MARYVVVVPLVPLAVGDEFTVAHWPLHVTLVEPFSTTRSDTDIAGVLDGVAGIGGPASAIHAVAGEESLFGRRRDVPVTLVQDGGELGALRSRALEALSAAGVEVRARLDFRPHVTRKHHGRVRRGDRIELAGVALIDMHPQTGGHRRRVVAAWRLGEASVAHR